MGYPGNQGQHGGWDYQSPHGRGDAEPAPPYGRDPYGGAGDDQPRPGGSPYRPLDDTSYVQTAAPYGPADEIGSGGAGHSGTSIFSGPPPGAGPGGHDAYAAGEAYGAGERHDGYDSPAEGIGYERARGHSGPRDPHRSGRNRRVLTIAAGGALLIALAGGGVVFALSGGSGPSGNPPAAKPGGAAPGAAPAQSPAPRAQPENIRTREADPKPLTLDEVFKKTRFSEGGGSYIMTNRRSDKKCASAVTGSSLETALRKARCTQLLRATFTTTGGKLVGTIGIANLSTENAAKAAVKSARGGRNYVEPLRGKGNTRTLGRSGTSAVGTADVRGHYLILSWVQYPSGKKIAKEHYPAISKFERNVIVGCNLGFALGQRMVKQ